MPYPITEEHKRVALENIKRIAPEMELRLIDMSPEGHGWQIEVRNPKTEVLQLFDAYLVGENFLKRAEFADLSLIAELKSYGLRKE